MDAQLVTRGECFCGGARYPDDTAVRAWWRERYSLRARDQQPNGLVPVGDIEVLLNEQASGWKQKYRRVS